MNYLSNCTIKNKKVLLRCDFNVPIKNGIITDDNKIISSLKTIKYLLDNDNIVIILSHFGRVKSEDDKDKNSLYPVYKYLKKHINNIEFITNPFDLSLINTNDNNCYLIENTRFTDVPEKMESVNDLDLAKYWASFADVFVIDAFASLHRIHSSTAGVSKYLPTYLGFLVEKEITNLKPLIDNNSHPFLVIMGGAKVDDKIDIINNLIKKCDKLFITGGILNSFLSVIGKNTGNSLVSKDESVLKSIRNILDNYANKIYFTNKFVIERNNKAINVNIEEVKSNDIIYDNIPDVKEIIKSAKIIFMNGTCGKFEEEEYSQGTKKMIEILKKNENVYIGGGDTISAVNKFAKKTDFKYLSSGGGATLEYIAYGNLKALEWIEKEGIKKE